MDIKKIKDNLLREESGISINTTINLGKFITLIPTAFLSAITKVPKFNINKEMTNKILEEGLYHCTLNEDVSENIVLSEHVNASKRTVSYGINEWAFFFAGPPDFTNFMKNMYGFSSNVNPLVHPDMVVDAIKFMPKKEDLKNYRCRAVNDEVIMYQGTCILPHQSVDAVKLIPDLFRNKEGNPIQNSFGEYSIVFREANKDDFIQGTYIYIPKQDYLDFVKIKAREKDYIQQFSKNNKFVLEKNIINALNNGVNIWNSVNSLLDVGLMEGYSSIDRTKKNYKDILKYISDKFKNKNSKKMITQSIESALDQYKLDKKNPFRDRKFSQKIAKLQTEGIIQEDLKQILFEFSNSKVGAFFSKKYKNIESNIQGAGTHGKEHAERVSLLAMMIAEKEGVFSTEDKFRYMDILSTAAMYHNIGRKLDFGPHALSGASKVKRMELEYIDGRKYNEADKRIVMALIESHTGKADKIDYLIKKYQISDMQEKDTFKKLSSILRDADALDRVRIDFNGIVNYKVNLKSNFLANRVSKAMITAAYQLESIRKSIGNMQSIIDYNLNPKMVDEINDIGFFKPKSELRESVVVEKVPFTIYKSDNDKSNINEDRGIV